MSRINSNTHPLLTEEILDELKEKKIYTIYQFIDQDSQVLAKITKLSFKDILLIRKHILKENSAEIHNALNYYQEIIQKTTIISTYYPQLDNILDGGFIPGNSYELCTISSPLRTKFLYKFLIQLISKQQNNESVMLYDTKHTFNAFYLKFISDQLYGPDSIIDNLFIQQTRDIYNLVQVLYDLREKLVSRSINVKVLIIDSFPAALYFTTQIDKFNMMLNSLIGIINCIMIEFQVCVIVTNMLVSDGKDIATSSKVAGGKYWQTLPNVRLRLINSNDSNKCKVTILKNNQGAVNKQCEIVI